MLRKMLGIFTAVATALVVVGAAWASSDTAASTSLAGETRASVAADGLSASADVHGSSSAALDADSSSVSLGGESSTSASLAASTSTSQTSSTSTSVASTTSTTIDNDGTTSTTVDDNDLALLVAGTQQYVVGSAGSVTVLIVGGQLSLATVIPNAGWSFEIEKNRSDEIEVGFEKGEAEADFRIRIESDGELRVRIESEDG